MENPKRVAAAFAFNNFIYCFCGETKNSSYTNTMEKLTIGEESWKMVTVKSSMPKRRLMNGIQINEKQVLMFGRYDSLGFDKESYFLDMEADAVRCE